MLSFAEMIVLNSVCNKKKIQMFLLNMALISLVKRKNMYVYISCVASTHM